MISVIVYLGHQPRLGGQSVVELGEATGAVTSTHWERVFKQKVQLKWDGN